MEVFEEGSKKTKRLEGKKVREATTLRLASERASGLSFSAAASGPLLSCSYCSLGGLSLVPLLLERSQRKGREKERSERKREEKARFCSTVSVDFELFFKMGACTSSPLVADDDLVVEALAPGPDHAIARFKNQDVAALATKYMPRDALTASAMMSSTSTTTSTTTMMPRLISSVPSPPSTFHHLPPLALGALGDNSLDDEPGARTVRSAPQGEIDGGRWKEEENFNPRVFGFVSFSQPSLSFKKKKKQPGRAPTLTPPTLSQAPPSHLPRHCELAYAPPYIPPPGLFPAGGGGGAPAPSTSGSAAPLSRQQRDDSSWRPSRRRAVFVAVGSGPLGFPGAVSDAECVRRAMARAFGFSLEETIFLHDGNEAGNDGEKTAAPASSSSSSPPRPNPQLRRLLPTRNNIMASARWLAAGARPGDSLVFAFFGRGGDARGRPLGEEKAAAAAESSSGVARGGDGNDSDEEDSATSASPSGKQNKRSEQRDTATSSNAAAFFLRPPSADSDERATTRIAASSSSSSPRKEASDPSSSSSSSLPRVAATLLPCDAVSAAARAQAQPSSSSSSAAAALFLGRTAAAAAAAVGASSAAAISSTDLRAALVDPLPAGARLLVLVDAAGNGSG